jgi:hypothetical protein
MTLFWSKLSDSFRFNYLTKRSVIEPMKALEKNIKILTFKDMINLKRSQDQKYLKNSSQL